jgi:hypothetical protein
MGLTLSTLPIPAAPSINSLSSTSSPVATMSLSNKFVPAVYLDHLPKSPKRTLDTSCAEVGPQLNFESPYFAGKSTFLQHKSLYELNNDAEVDHFILQLAEKLTTVNGAFYKAVTDDKDVYRSRITSTSSTADVATSPDVTDSGDSEHENVLLVDTTRCLLQSPRYISR